MMNREEAMAYGRKTGCKYFVRNNNGGLMGGYVNRSDAEDCLSRCRKEYGNIDGIIFYISES